MTVTSQPIDINRTHLEIVRRILDEHVPSGVVLLSKLNPEIQRAGPVEVQDHEKEVCSAEFLILMPCLPLGRSIIYLLSHSNFIKQHLTLLTGTSNHQRAQSKAILDIPIPQ